MPDRQHQKRVKRSKVESIVIIKPPLCFPIPLSVFIKHKLNRVAQERLLKFDSLVVKGTNETLVYDVGGLNHEDQLDDIFNHALPLLKVLMLISYVHLVLP